LLIVYRYFHARGQAIDVIMGCMRAQGGSLRQIVEDDKGFVVIITFGTPFAAHENDCVSDSSL
jgi:hypothetical protein